MMKRRNFLQSLAAIGIGSAIVKPTIAEEVKTEVPILKDEWTEITKPKVEFVIKGKDLVAVLTNKVRIYSKGKLKVEGHSADVPPYPRGEAPMRIMDRPISFICPDGINLKRMEYLFYHDFYTQMEVDFPEGVMKMNIMIQEIKEGNLPKKEAMILCQVSGAIIFEKS